MALERMVMAGVWWCVIFLLSLPESVTREVPFYWWAQAAAWGFVAWRLIHYLRWRIKA